MATPAGHALGIEVIRDAGKAAVLMHRERRRLLELLVEPNSASGIARMSGISRQQVTYHLRELENKGFLELVEEKRKGNCTERLMRATARMYVISQEALGTLGEDPERRCDRFSIAHLVATAARAIRELTLLSAGATRAGKNLPALTLETCINFAHPKDRADFAEELESTVAKLTAKYHKDVEGSRKYKLFLGVHPAMGPNEQFENQPSVRMPEH